MENTLILFILSLSLASSFKVYLEECIDGYFREGAFCKPCHSSCKTCSNANFCDSCQDYLFLNSSSQLCEHCPSGEYFDITRSSCCSCAGSCNSFCKYQTHCLQCSSEEYFNLETTSCITECPNGTVNLESAQLKIPKVCRSTEYYVDPYSTKPLELGTLEFPYRNMRSVTSEITNFHSHTPVDLTIFVKEAYIEDETVYYLNMSSIKITNHPEYSLMGKNGMLIPTSVPQTAIQEQAQFHLLVHTDIMIAEQTSSAQFSDIERDGFLVEEVTIKISRTSFIVENIDFYQEEDFANAGKILLYPLYLHEKWMIISKQILHFQGY